MPLRKTISKDWVQRTLSNPKATLRIETEEAKSVADLPELLDKVKVAQYLKCGESTAANLLKSGEIRSFMLTNKRVTTAEYIAEYLRRRIKGV